MHVYNSFLMHLKHGFEHLSLCNLWLTTISLYLRHKPLSNKWDLAKFVIFSFVPNCDNLLSLCTYIIVDNSPYTIYKNYVFIIGLLASEMYYISKIYSRSFDVALLSLYQIILYPTIYMHLNASNIGKTCKSSMN